MRKTITDEEFWRQLATFERSAWRFEQQPSYAIGYEQKIIDDFLAGHPSPPDTVLEEWMTQVAEQTAAGKTVGRVRIIDEPMTDYQRWLKWLDAWNLKSGETIDYLTRRYAREVGLLPAVGASDWWLFDDERLMLMIFDEAGRRVRVELLTDEPEVAKARRYRDLAIRAAREENRATEPGGNRSR
jgi:hypothetical protein